MRFFSGWRLRHTLFAALLALSITPLVIAGLFGVTQLQTVVQHETEATLRVTADGARGAVLEFLEYLKARTLDVAADWYIRDSVAAHRIGPDLERYLSVNRSHIPESVEIFVLDPNGRVVASSEESSVGRDDSRTEYFRRGRTDVHLTSLFRGPDGSVWWVATAPLIDRHTHAFIGVLANRVDKRALSDITTGRYVVALGATEQSMRRGASGEVYVVDRDGLMLTESRFRGDTILVTKVESEPVVRARTKRKPMLGDYVDYRGVRVAGASAVVSEMGWTVLAEIDAAEAFEPARRLTLELGLLGLAILPALALLGFLIERGIARPIRQVIDADERVVRDGPRAGLIDERTFGWLEWTRVVTMRNAMLRRLHEQSNQLRAETDRRRREAEVAADLVERLSASAELEQVLDRIADGAAHVCASDVAEVLVRDGGREARRHVGGVEAERWRRLPPLAPSALADAVLTGTPLRVVGGALATAAPEAGGPEPVWSAVAVSITVDGHSVGALLVASRAPRAFDERDADTLRRLSDYATIALKTARLLGEQRDAGDRKDRFLATLAHELRTPLAAIMNAVHALDVIGAPGDEPGRFRAIIRRQSRHLARLVDDLLDVSRIGSGKIRLERRHLDLRDVARRSVDAMELAGRAERSRIMLVAPPERVPVDGDPMRLEQIVRNLLDNALKYSAVDTPVRVTVAREGTRAVLRVRDEGIGIASDDLPRVFDLFVQSDQAIGRDRGGLGLGLALVRALVDEHHGQVTAHSAGVGRGSEFAVTLPLAADLHLPDVHEEPRALSRALRILVVEDHPDARESLRVVLAMEGHDVQTAADGHEALRMALAAPPELALIDLGLPGIDGYELARRLRASPAGQSMYLVALSGYGQPDDVRRAIDAGFHDHVVKPVDPDRLSRLVAAVAAMRSAG